MKHSLKLAALAFFLCTGFAAAQLTYDLTAVHAPVRPSDGNHSYWVTAQQYAPGLITSQTPLINGGNNSPDGWAMDTETGTGKCTAVFGNWSPLGTNLDTMVSGTSLKTNIIVVPADEGNTSNATPVCVWSQAQANASALTWAGNAQFLAGWYILVGSNYWQIKNGCMASTYDNSCTTGSLSTWGTLSACFSSKAGTIGATCTDGTTGVGGGTFKWTNLGTSAPLQDGYCGAGHTCSGCNVNNPGAIYQPGNPQGCTATQLYNAMPIPELPYWNWYKQVITGLISHFNASSSLSNIGFFDFGYPMGGELGGLDVSGWPYGGTTWQQNEAQYISWVRVLDAYIMAQNPKMMIFSDINCAAGISGGKACDYADQEANLADADHMQGIRNADALIEDYYNLTGQGTNNCVFPLVAASACTEGDWAYNFAAHPTMYHGLQTLNGSSPADCMNGTPGFTGPLAGLPAGSPYCANGYPGLLPGLIALNSTGVGSPNVKIKVNVFEADTTSYAPAASCPDGAPAWACSSLSDVLFTLLPWSTYLLTTNSISQDQPYQGAYQAAFSAFLSQK